MFRAMPVLRALLTACTLYGIGPGAVAGGTVHTVVIDGMLFIPAELTVKRGDTVRWLNKDAFPHTATSQAKGFDSRDIAPGGSWKFVAAKPGSYPYLCTLHRTMKGKLIVK